MTKGSSRNRLAGLAYEEEIVKHLNKLEVFPKVGRTAELNKLLDKKKLDIIPVDPEDFKDFVYNIQAKSSTKVVPYGKLIADLKYHFKGIPVVLHKKTTRVASDRFLTEGTFAILEQDDFLNIISDLERYTKGYRLLMEYWDSLPDTEKLDLHNTLEKLGL